MNRDDLPPPKPPVDLVPELLVHPWVAGDRLEIGRDPEVLRELRCLVAVEREHCDQVRPVVAIHHRFFERRCRSRINCSAGKMTRLGVCRMNRCRMTGSAASAVPAARPAWINDISMAVDDSVRPGLAA